MNNPVYDVFISYSRRDTDTVNRICEAFDANGISYFIDRHGIQGGLEFPKVLAQAIKDSRIFLFVASRHSYESKFTQSEIVFAFNKKAKTEIIPYIIDDSQLPEELEFTFSAINWRTMRQHPIATVLVDDVLYRLGRERKPAEAPQAKPADTPKPQPPTPPAPPVVPPACAPQPAMPAHSHTARSRFSPSVLFDDVSQIAQHHTLLFIVGALVSLALVYLMFAFNIGISIGLVQGFLE